MATFQQIQTATMAARRATGMPGIGTQVNAGRFQVVNVSYGKRGKSDVLALSDWISVDAAIEVLRQIEADKGWH
jgi:hypothetical protein